MKALAKSFFVLMTLGNLVVTIADLSIDQKIENIKNAPPEQRVKMMNQFKLQMAKMNQQDRANAINTLQEKIQNKKNTTPTTTGSKMTRPNLDEYMDNSLQNTQHLKNIR